MRKTIIVHVEGIPRQSPASRETRTLLQRAATPHLDELARIGEMGQLSIPGETRRFCGELALLALLGYDTHKWYTGPGPFEAAGLEVILDKHDVAFLCHLVTLRSQEGWGEGKKLGSLMMEDPSGGGIDNEEARELLDAINDQLVSENIQFYFGRDHRHLMVWAGGGMKTVCRNPQEAVGQSIDAFLPTGDGAQVLRELMEASRVILNHHDVNQERIQAGLKPANCLWLWGPGKALELPKLSDRWPVKGAVVASDGPLLGVGVTAGLHTVRVDEVKEEGTGRLKALLPAVLQALEKLDFVYWHIPGRSDEARAEDVVQHWEHIDSEIIGPIRNTFLSEEKNRLLVMGTSMPGCNAEAPELSGYVFCEGGGQSKVASSTGFDEKALAGQPTKDATKFFERFIVQ